MQRQARRGFLSSEAVWKCAFWVIASCLVVATTAAILAIWDFAGTDVLWRTVATCAVIGVATLAFSWVNLLFGRTDD